jgi:hypothetical protein
VHWLCSPAAGVDLRGAVASDVGDVDAGAAGEPRQAVDAALSDGAEWPGSVPPAELEEASARWARVTCAVAGPVARRTIELA